jgi:hypothetical protein
MSAKQQVLKHVAGHRIPLIKFTHGINALNYNHNHNLSASNSVIEAEAAAAANLKKTSSISTNSRNSSNYSKQVLIDFFQVPKKYQRRPIDMDELEVINVSLKLKDHFK